MKIIVFLSMLLLVPLASLAADSSIVYTKATIRIVPAPGTVGPQPAASSPTAETNSASPTEAKKPGGAKDIKPVAPAPAPRQTKELSVEVRPLSILERKDFIVHEPFTEKKGLLVLIDPPRALALKAAPLLGNTDVLLVTTDGIIAKIAPNLNLEELDEPIEADSPVHAFVFLKAGVVQQLDIQPGDKVQSSLFKTHPIVLDSTHRTVIIGNSPPAEPEENQAEPQHSPHAKRQATPKDEPSAAEPPIVYPPSSVPAAQSQQLIQQLQK